MRGTLIGGILKLLRIDRRRLALPVEAERRRPTLREAIEDQESAFRDFSRTVVMVRERFRK